MTISRAFTYYLSDPDWVTKLLIMMIVTGISFTTSPLLIGALGMALLFGYQSALIRNVRANFVPPLPHWRDLGGMLMEGLPVLIAYVVYNLPNLFMGAFTWLVTTLSADTNIVSGGVSLVVACCLFPLILLLNLVLLPMFTIAQGRYAETRRFNEFYQFGTLFDKFRTRFDAISQWWIGMILAYILFTFMSVTVIGIPVVLALIVPITGALAGMLHAAAYETPEKAKSR